MTRGIEVIALPTGEFTFPDGFRYIGQTGVVVAYAIRHPAGTFLFDTGFALPTPELEPFYSSWQVRVRALPEVLADGGVDRAEITALANCHLHVDHSGQNALFRGVPNYVQPAEYAAAAEPDYSVAEVIRFPGARFEQIAGDHEVAPGIRIFATPGHSPGHQSLVVESPDGPLLLAGQAVYTRGEWVGLADAMEGATYAPDGEAYRRSIERLRALNPKRVLFGHDRHGWPD